MKYLLTFTITLLLSIPAILVISADEAQALPGSILGESRQDGDRSHNMERRNDRSSSDRNRSRSERRETTTRRRSANRSDSARPVGPRRVVPDRPTRSRSSRHRDRRSSRHSRTSRRTRSTVSIHSSSHSSSHRTGHHHHPDDEPSSNHASESTVDGYITFGAGASGFASSQISDLALPGAEFNVGIGANGDLFGVELGINGGGYTFDSQMEIAVNGMSLDLKAQPSLGFLEPYALVGIGGYHFQDAYLNETALGGALRFGAGLDIRVGDFALGARYLRNHYGFSNSRSFYNGLGAQTESVGLNLTFYQ